VRAQQAANPFGRYCRDAKSAQFDDADRWPRRVVSPLGRYRGRLCVAGRWVREAGGRHLARFADGQEVWVTYGPGDQKEFAPLGWAAA
jgi:hypothetical protein